MKKILKMSLFVLIVSNLGAQTPPSNQTITAQDLETKSASDIYKIITGLQVRVFSTDKSYLHVGLQEFDVWSSLLVAVGNYFSKQKKIPLAYYNPKEPNSYFFQLQAISVWLDSTIKGIQQGRVSPNNFPQVLNQIESKLKQTKNIIRVTFGTIVDSTTRGASTIKWEQGVKGLSPETIFPEIDSFLSEYKVAKAKDKSNYVYRQNVIDKYEARSKYQIESLLEKLRKIIYIQEQKLFFMRNGLQLRRSKAVLDDISLQYPATLYPYVNAKFADSKDKASIMLLGIADSLHGGLLHFKKDLAAR